MSKINAVVWNKYRNKMTHDHTVEISACFIIYILGFFLTCTGTIWWPFWAIPETRPLLMPCTQNHCWLRISVFMFFVLLCLPAEFPDSGPHPHSCSFSPAMLLLFPLLKGVLFQISATAFVSNLYGYGESSVMYIRICFWFCLYIGICALVSKTQNIWQYVLVHKPLNIGSHGYFSFFLFVFFLNHWILMWMFDFRCCFSCMQTDIYKT